MIITIVDDVYAAGGSTSSGISTNPDDYEIPGLAGLLLDTRSVPGGGSYSTWIVYGDIGRANDYIEFSLQPHSDSSYITNAIAIISNFNPTRFPEPDYRFIQWIPHTADNHYISTIKANNNAISGTRGFNVGDYYVEIHGVFKSKRSDDEVLWIFDHVEAKARELMQGKNTMDLVHYGAFSPEALDNKVPAGTVTATVKDANGNPVSGKPVFFFLAEKQDNYDALQFPEWKEFLAEMLPEPVDASTGTYLRSSLGYPQIDWARVMIAVTDKEGKASLNYFNYHVDYDAINRAIGDRGECNYTLYAFVFNRSLTETRQNAEKPKVMASSSAPVVYKSMAVISWVSEQYQDKYSPAVVTPNDLEQGRIQPDVTVTQEKCPYPLKQGDLVRMAYFSRVNICWINGLRLTIEPDKKFVEAQDEGYKYAFFAFDDNIANLKEDSIASLKVFHWVHLITSPIEMLMEWDVPPAAIAIGVATYVVNKKAEQQLETQSFGYPIRFEQLTDPAYSCGEPVYWAPHSKILLHMGNTTSVYTLEGTGTFFDKNGGYVNVTGGNKMEIARDGTLGPVTGFSQNDLSADDRELISFATAAGKTSSTSPTPMPASPSASKQSSAPGLLAGALAIVAVVCLLRRKRCQ